MSAEAVGSHMPAAVTLDDLAAMNAADTHGHRYETSPKGVLSVMPRPDSDHAVIAARLMLWLGAAGWPAEQLMQAAGVRIPGPDGEGGRIPDLTVWSKPQAETVTLRQLGPTGYEVTAQMPLARLLQTSPANHLPAPG